MPKSVDSAAGGALPALARVVRLRLAIAILRFGNRLARVGDRIITSVERGQS